MASSHKEQRGICVLHEHVNRSEFEVVNRACYDVAMDMESEHLVNSMCPEMASKSRRWRLMFRLGVLSNAGSQPSLNTC